MKVRYDYTAFTTPDGAPVADRWMMVRLRPEALSDDQVAAMPGAVPFYTKGCPTVDGAAFHGVGMCPDCMDDWSDYRHSGKSLPMTDYAPTHRLVKGGGYERLDAS